VGRFRVIRHDVRGVGESLPPTGPWSHHTDLLGLLDELLITRAHVVGASMGAGIAVEAALARPGSVSSLVLVAPGGALFDGTPAAFRPIWAAEVDALDRGDLDAAVEINLRAWVDGPQRGPDAVDPELRTLVGRMQREAFELPQWDADAAPEHELSPPASARFAELACPVLVVVGDADDPAIVAVAERIAAEAPRARLAVWPGVGHMLSLERPDAFAELLEAFLDDVESGRFDGLRAEAPASTGPGAAASDVAVGEDTARSGPLRYVALGDSYTIGTGLEDAADRWPDRLVAALARTTPGLELVANLGVNGYTTQDVIERELPRLAGLRPEFASLLVGVNDVVQGVSIEAIRANVTAILDALLAYLPSTRIAVVAIPDYTVTPEGAAYGDPTAQAARIRAANQAISEVAAAQSVAWVDIHDLSLRAADDRSLVAADGLHPSGAQYAGWVERIAPAVRELTNR
jgi:3-oxoadipate enol-lactonase